MGYQVRFEDKTAYLLCTVRGERTLDNAVDFFTGLSRELTERKHHKCLVISRLRGTLSTSELYDVLSRRSAFGFTARHRIAFVHDDGTSPDYLSFGENVAQNRGWDVRAFTTESDALASLLDPRR